MNYLKVGGLLLALGVCVFVTGAVIMYIKKEIDEELKNY